MEQLKSLMTKRCYTCKIDKQIKQFYRQKGTKDGFRGNCKSCQYTPRPISVDPKESLHRMLYRSCGHSAIARKLSFELTLIEHKQLISQNCVYCGRAPASFNPRKKKSVEAYIFKNGIDRIDNEVGYEPSNCAAACQQCNYGRQDYSVTEFLEHCRRITEYQRLKNG